MYSSADVYHIEQSKEVVLPVGIPGAEGVFHRKVVLDKWRGIDHETLTEQSSRKNPSTMITALLRRMVQEIPGVVSRKTSPIHLLDSRHIDHMFDADRTFLLLQTLALRSSTESVMEFTCPHCQEEFEEDVDLCSLEVFPHDDTTETFVEFELPDEGVLVLYKDGEKENEVYTRGKFHYPKGIDIDMVGKKSVGEFAAMSRLFSRCVEMDGYGRITVQQAQMMSSEDREYLYELLGDSMPGVDQIVTVECPDCMKTEELGIDVTQFFFSKKRTSKRRGRT